MPCVIWKHVAPSLTPCLPAYLNPQWLPRPFLPVLLNQFFTCAHWSPTLWSLGDLSCVHSPQRLLYAEDPHTWLLRLWIAKHSLKQSWKVLWGVHLPNTDVTIFSSHTPQKKEWSVPSTSIGLGIKSWISHTLRETHTCMYAYTCTHLPRCKHLCVHLSLFFSDFVFLFLFFNLAVDPTLPKALPLFTSSSL